MNNFASTFWQYNKKKNLKYRKKQHISTEKSAKTKNFHHNSKRCQGIIFVQFIILTDADIDKNFGCNAIKQKKKFK
jgi:hypothetical protein